MEIPFENNSFYKIPFKEYFPHIINLEGSLEPYVEDQVVLDRSLLYIDYPFNFYTFPSSPLKGPLFQIAKRNFFEGY